MVLQNVNIPGHDLPVNIKTDGCTISNVSDEVKPGNGELVLAFDDAIAFPGLINSHDHLEFNLFPMLANRVYASYLEWGADIFQNNRDAINRVTSTPKQVRAAWGVFKNLLNGVTTVIHHGEHFRISNPVINVFQDCYSLHSVRREKNWKFKLNKMFPRKQPFVIHIGEGTDDASAQEVDELIKWNLYKRELIAVHGIAMNVVQARSFSALIWCPDSNFNLYNATAGINEIKNETRILFGTDSCVSAGWNLWEQLRVARKTKMLTDEELFHSLTAAPAAAWGLEGAGAIRKGMQADLVIARKKTDQKFLDSFFQTNPSDLLLVLCRGEIALFDEQLYPLLHHRLSPANFTKLYVDAVGKYVKGNLRELIGEIRKVVPEIGLPVELDEP